MLYTAEDVRSVAEFRAAVSKFPPDAPTKHVVLVRNSDDESIILVALRALHADVLLRRVTIAAAKAKLATIVVLLKEFREENCKDPESEAMIDVVENACVYIEAEDRGEIEIEEVAA